MFELTFYICIILKMYLCIPDLVHGDVTIRKESLSVPMSAYPQISPYGYNVITMCIINVIYNAIFSHCFTA